MAGKAHVAQCVELLTYLGLSRIELFHPEMTSLFEVGPVKVDDLVLRLARCIELSFFGIIWDGRLAVILFGMVRGRAVRCLP